MKITESVPIATIAAEMPAARALFESLGIDYACGGQRSLGDAAHAEGLDPEIVIAGLRRITPEHGEQWHDRPLRDLVQYLMNEHHHFVRDEMMSLALWLSDLCAPPAKPKPDLQSLRAAFTRLSEKVLPHLHDEEAVFGHIETLETEWHTGDPPHGDGDLGAHIQRLMADHATIAAQLRSIRSLHLRLMTEEELPMRIRRALDAVGSLEAHLHEYMFLENCVLFPRAIALEQQMMVA